MSPFIKTFKFVQFLKIGCISHQFTFLLFARVGVPHCPNCGKELIFVCADCFEKIEDMGPEVKLCKECEAKKAAKKEKIKAGVDTAKKIAGKGVELAPAAIGLVKNPKAKNALKAGTNFLKKKKTGGI